MKKTFLVLTAFLGALTNAFAAWETEGSGTLVNGTWYALYDQSEHKEGGSGGGFDWGPLRVTSNLSAPGEEMSLQAKVSSSWSTSKEVRAYEGEGTNQIGSSTSVGTSYKTYGPYSMTANNDYTSVRSELSGNFGRYIKNIFVVQASYIVVDKTTIDFGSIPYGGEEPSADITIKYSNGKTNTAGFSAGTLTNFEHNIPAKEAGKYGQFTSQVVFHNTQRTGDFSETLKLTNGISTQNVTILLKIVPPAPTANEATDVTYKTLTANWNLSAEALGYVVSIFDEQGNLLKEAVVDENTTSYTFNDLACYTKYTYKVQALGNNDVRSEFSNAIEATTLQTTISLENTFDLFTGRETQKSVTLNMEDDREAIIAALETGTIFSVSAEGKTVTVLFTPATAGQYSDVLSVNTRCATTPITINVNGEVVAPAAPAAAAATNVLMESFTANWGVVEGEAITYNLVVKKGDDEVMSKTGITTNSYEVKGLEPATEYTYVVYAMQYGLVESEASATTPVTTLPRPVITVSSEAVEFSVEDNAIGEDNITFGGENLLGEIEYKMQSENSVFSAVATEEGLKVSFAPTAYGEVKDTLLLTSDYAETVKVALIGNNTLAVVAVADADNVTPVSFTAKWTKKEDESVTYTVKVTTEADEEVVVVENIAVDTLDVISLEPDTKYHYTVVASAGNFVSEVSDVIEVTTLKKPIIMLDQTAYSSTDYNNKPQTTTISYTTENAVEEVKVELENESGNYQVNVGEQGNVEVVFTPNSFGKDMTLVVFTTLYADTVKVTLDNENILAAPVATEATSITRNSFVANWEAIEVDNVQYNLVVKHDADTLNVYENIDATLYEVTGLSVETEYTYDVHAVVGDVESEASNAITVVTKANPVIKPLVDNLKFFTEAGATQSLNIAYELENMTDEVVAELKNTSVQFAIEVADENAFKVTYSSAVAGVFTDTVVLKGGDAEEVLIPLKAVTIPTEPVATEASNIRGLSFVANWTETEPNATYLVTVMSGNDVIVEDKEVEGTSLKIENLKAETEYVYTVKAKVDTLISLASNEIMVTTIAAPAIKASVMKLQFEVLAGQSDNGAVSISCNDLMSDVLASVGTTLFTLDVESVSKDGGEITVTFSPTSAGVFVDTLKLTNDEAEMVKVVLEGNSIPVAPVATEASDIRGLSFVANWEATETNAKYLLTVLKGNTELFVDREVENASSVVTGLEPNTEYTYYVKVVVDELVSAASNEIKVSTINGPSVSYESFDEDFSAEIEATDSRDITVICSDLSEDVTVGMKNGDVGFGINQTSVDKAGGVFTITFAPVVAGEVKDTILLSNKDVETIEIPVEGVASPHAIVATDATNVRGLSFVANWNEVEGATYLLTVKKTNGEIHVLDYAVENNYCYVTAEAETTYLYSVKAVVNGVASSLSNEVSVTTLKAPSVTYDEFETDFSCEKWATVSRKVKVHMHDIAHNVVATLSNENQGFVLNDFVLVNDGDEVEIVFTQGTSGNFASKLILSANEVDDVEIDLTATVVPMKPYIDASANSNAITVKWTAEEGVTSYAIVLDGGEPVVVNATEAMYVISNLEAGSTHAIQVMAIDANGLYSAPYEKTITLTVKPVISPVSDVDFGVVEESTEMLSQTVTVDGTNLVSNIWEETSDEAFLYEMNEDHSSLNISISPREAGDYVSNFTLRSTEADDVTFKATVSVIPAKVVVYEASNISASQFTAEWKAVEGATAYVVTLKDADPITTEETSYTFTGLTANTAYEYSLQVVKNGKTSNPVWQTTQTAAPATFSLDNVIVGTNNIGLVWSTEGTLTNIVITCNSQTYNVTDGATSYTIASLASNATYSGKITAMLDGASVEKTFSAHTLADNTGVYGDQLPNYTFDSWENEGKDNVEPTGWNSFMTGNASGLTSFGKGKAIDKSTTEKRPGTTGTAAGYIWARNPMSSIIANGNVTTGCINLGSTNAQSSENYNFTDTSRPEFAAPMTQVPDSMTVWVKFESGNPSKGPAGVIAYIHDNVNFRDPVSANQAAYLVATASSDIDANNSNWVRVSVPFVKTNNGAKPKYVLCTFKTNNLAAVGTKNEKLYFDDALMIYNPTLAITEPATQEFMQGSALTVPYTITGTMSPYNLNAAANQVILEISTSPSFATATVTELQRTTTNASGTAWGVLPTDLAEGTYYARVRTTNYPMTSSAFTFNVKAKKKGGDEPAELGTPVALAADNIEDMSFNANWNFAANATGYRLTVKSPEGDILSNYDHLDVGNVRTYNVAGLATAGTYSYSVEAYDATDTSAASNEVMVVMVGEPTGIEEQEVVSFALNIYPNPVDDVLYIENAEVVKEAYVYSANGAMLFVDENVEDGIEVSDLARGNYLLVVKTIADKTTHKVFVKK